MVFDLNMIKKVYREMEDRIKTARNILNRPLLLSEKILYSHMSESKRSVSVDRGKSYVDFNPDRVAMQDATAQMALLQFIMAGKSKVSVPSSVHCDHLIQANISAEKDLIHAKNTNSEVYDFF